MRAIASKMFFECFIYCRCPSSLGGSSKGPQTFRGHAARVLFASIIFVFFSLWGAFLRPSFVPWGNCLFPLKVNTSLSKTNRCVFLFIIYSFICIFILCFACVWMRERVCWVVHLMNKYIASKWKLFIFWYKFCVLFLCIEISGIYCWLLISSGRKQNFSTFFASECNLSHDYSHKHNVAAFCFALLRIPFCPKKPRQINFYHFHFHFLYWMTFQSILFVLYQRITMRMFKLSSNFAFLWTPLK